MGAAILRAAIRDVKRKAGRETGAPIEAVSALDSPCLSVESMRAVNCVFVRRLSVGSGLSSLGAGAVADTYN